MTIDVEVPIRIVTDAATLVHRPEALLSAISAATRRALEHSRQEVLLPVGGYLGVSLDRPSVSWSGEAASTIPAMVRSALEDALAADLVDVADDAGLFRLADLAAKVPPPLAEPPRERARRDRLSGLLRLYQVPSYEGGAEWLQVNYDERIYFGEKLMPGWAYLAAADAADLKKWRDKTLALAGFNEDNKPPQGRPYGILTPTTNFDPESRWHLFVTKDGTEWFEIYFAGFFEYQVEGFGKDAKVARKLVAPRTGNGLARWMDKPASEVEGLTLMQDRFGSLLEADIRRFAKDLTELTHEQLEEVVQTAVGFHLLELWKTVETSAVFLDIEVGDKRLLLGMPADAGAIRWEGEAYLYPNLGAVPRTKPITYGKGGLGGGKKAPGAGSDEAGTGSSGGKDGGQGTEGQDGSGDKGSKGDGKGGARPRYPGLQALFQFALVCEPFRGERTMTQIGRKADRLRRMMESVAYSLNIETCDYAANFCLNAASALSGRVVAIGQHSARDSAGAYFTDPVRQGNLGLIRFVPTISPAMRMLRYSAGTAALIDQLAHEVLDLAQFAKAEMFEGEYATHSVPWRLRFLEEYKPQVAEAVANLFIMTCRVLMLQMLKSSREEIDKRINHFNSYAPYFELLMASTFQRQGEMEFLRDRLKHASQLRIAGQVADSPAGMAAQGASPWLAASASLVKLLSGGQALIYHAGSEGEVVFDGPEPRVRDSQGILWTAEQIEIALLMARGTGEGADPLVKQLFDIPDVMEKFKANPTSIRTTLWDLLKDMERNNQEQEMLVRMDWLYAFRASKINEDIPNATVPRSKYRLGGIHLEAHKQIGEFFLGQPCYAEGLNYAFDVELGKQGLIHFVEFAGIVALSVLCPPAGVALGVGVAVNELDKAYRQKRLYQSLINPEKVLTQAEVELDLYIAWIGFALSLIPEAGTVIGAARQGVKTAFKEGARAGAKAAGEFVAKKIATQIAEALARDILEVLIRDMVTAMAIQEVVQRLASPIAGYAMEQLEMVHSTGGPEGAQAMIRSVIARHARERQEAHP